VRELVSAVNAVRGTELDTVDGARRSGDVVGAFTRVDRARQLLDWECKFTIMDGVAHSLEWARRRPSVLREITD
jgi:UDP-glucose 4-epimerase